MLYSKLYCKEIFLLPEQTTYVIWWPSIINLTFILLTQWLVQSITMASKTLQTWASWFWTACNWLFNLVPTLRWCAGDSTVKSEPNRELHRSSEEVHTHMHTTSSQLVVLCSDIWWHFYIISSGFFSVFFFSEAKSAGCLLCNS